MAISYLSKPIAPGVIPEQAPIELIAQVAQQKQVKYDTMLTAIMGQYENLLSLDTSAGSLETTNRYNQLMSQANKDITALAKLDLMNPDNVDKIENVFNPILGDSVIMSAVSETQRVQKEKMVMEYWRMKNPDKYNAMNYSAFIDDLNYNRNLSEADWVDKRLNPMAVEYVDVDAHFRNQIKDLPWYKGTITKADGSKWIVTKEDEELPYSTILKALSVDSKVQAQMEINSRFSLQEYSPQDIVLGLRKDINLDIKNQKENLEKLNQKSTKIDGELLLLENKNSKDILSSNDLEAFQEIYPRYSLPEDLTYGELKKLIQGEKKNVVSQIEDYSKLVSDLEQEIDNFDSEYEITETSPNLFSVGKPFDIRDERSLKTRYYTQTKKKQIAEAFQGKKTSLTIRENEFARSRQDFIEAQILANQKHQHELRLKMIEAETGQLSTETLSGNTSSNSTNKSSKVPLLEISSIPSSTGQVKFNADFITSELNSTKQVIEQNTNDLAMSLASAETGQLAPTLSSEKKQEYTNKAKTLIEDYASALNEISIHQANNQGKLPATVTMSGIKYSLEQFNDNFGYLTSYYDNEQNALTYSKLVTKINEGLSSVIASEPSTVNFTTFKVKDGNMILSPSEKQLLQKEGGFTETFLKTLYNRQLNAPQGAQFLKREDTVVDGKPYVRAVPISYEEFKASALELNKVNSSQVLQEKKERMDNALSQLSVNKNDTAYAVVSGTDLFNSFANIAVNEARDTKGKPIGIDVGKITSIKFIPSKEGLSRIQVTWNEGSGTEPSYASTEVKISSSALQTLQGNNQLKIINTAHSADKVLDFLAIDAEARLSNPKYRNYSTQAPEATISVGGKVYRIQAESPNSFTILDPSIPGMKGIARGQSRATLIPKLLGLHSNQDPNTQYQIQELNKLYQSVEFQNSELFKVLNEY